MQKIELHEQSFFQIFFQRVSSSEVSDQELLLQKRLFIVERHMDCLYEMKKEQKSNKDALDYCNKESNELEALANRVVERFLLSKHIKQSDNFREQSPYYETQSKGSHELVQAVNNDLSSFGVEGC